MYMPSPMMPRMLHIARAGNAFQSGLAQGQCQYADPTSKHGGSFGKARAKFGVSPFGIYWPGVPAGIQAGVNQYEQLYGDPLKWLRESWIDYLAPQLYWRDGGSQSFSLLLRWWRGPQANPHGVPVWPGVAVDRLSSHGWTSGEIAANCNWKGDPVAPQRGRDLLEHQGAA